MQKSVLLIITGSIAAEKLPEVIRLLKEKDINVTCVVTESGKRFVDIEDSHSDLFSDDMLHIKLSRENDLIVVAPATADFLAKMAHGRADNLASAVVLASNKPILIAPAMNVMMWENPATKRNVKQLKKDGIIFIGPEKGHLACGEEGFGRMSEPQEIVDAIEYMWKEKPLSGKTVLVTSGATREPVDPVRFISNNSSGKQGYAIAETLANAGAKVTLITASSLLDPNGINVIHVNTAKEMLEACRVSVDIAVCVAAVSDWYVEPSKEKIKKTGADFSLTFTENPDILSYLSNREDRPSLVIGFAAETENIIKNAKKKLVKCDWIIANDVSDGKVFESNDNTVHFITKNAHESWSSMTKKEVAEQLTLRITTFCHPERSNSLRSEGSHECSSGDPSLCSG